jgi:hypothetical protein
VFRLVGAYPADVATWLRVSPVGRSTPVVAWLIRVFLSRGRVAVLVLGEAAS